MAASYISQVTADNTSSSVCTSSGISVQADDYLFVLVYRNRSDGVVSVTDSLGSTYDLVDGPFATANGRASALYYAKMASTNASVTVSFNVSGFGRNSFVAYQFRDLATSSVIDQHDAADIPAGTATSMTTGTTGTTLTNDFVVGFFAPETGNGAGYTAGSGYTAISPVFQTGDSNAVLVSEYQSFSSSAARTATMSFSSRTLNGGKAYIVALKTTSSALPSTAVNRRTLSPTGTRTGTRSTRQ